MPVNEILLESWLKNGPPFIWPRDGAFRRSGGVLLRSRWSAVAQQVECGYTAPPLQQVLQFWLIQSSVGRGVHPFSEVH